MGHAMRAFVLLTTIVFTLGAAYGQEPDLGTEEQRAAGKEVYDVKCAHCHGYAGEAMSVATPYLLPPPRDFTSGNYKFRSTLSGELPTTEDIIRSIELGMPYTSMPPWKGILSDTEIANLAYYLKTFDPAFAGPYGTPQPIEIPEAPAYDEAKIPRGKEVFAANQCADCHGVNGRGNGPSAPDLVDDWSYPIRPADMTKRWTFRASATREDVYRTFTTGLNGTPMPSYAQTITEEDRWALVDYVWSLSRDDPEYGTIVQAQARSGDLDITLGPALFEGAPATYFPIVGQVIESGRSFYPAANGINVSAVYNADNIAFMLSWHDMTAEAEGSNHPAMDVPAFGEAAASDSAMYSDAVALLLPATTPEGLERPYFMFGDDKNAMAIWFADLAAEAAQVYMGAGSSSITDSEEVIAHYLQYADGVWTVIFMGSRQRESGLHFEEAAFTPISFSVWDGASKERGNKRGISAWYHVYLEPLERPSPVAPMLRWAFIVLLIEIGVIGVVRWRHRKALG